LANFLLVYHGGTPMDNAAPEQQQATMAAWAAWFQKVGGGIVDVGNPIGRTWTLANDGTTEDGGANPATGYSVISADSMQAALDLTVGCPHLETGGTIQLCETFNAG
jgi:hypothetical protein